MFRKIIAVSAIIMGSMGFTQVAMAAEESAETATVVVYRADESFKTKKLGLDVHIGETSMGRLKSEQAVVITRPAGEYAVGTSIKGTEEVVLDLKPGQTYYIHTEMKLRGNRLQVEMVEVEEQVAKVQKPSLDGAI